MLVAWAWRNSRQIGPERRGAGPGRARASRRRILVGNARTASLVSSPQIRRCPRRGFSRASRNTSCRISGESRGRPGVAPGWRHFRRTSDRCQRRSVRGVSTDRRGLPRRPDGCRHFQRTSARCQRSSVRGVTRRPPREERGRWQAAAASRADQQAEASAMRPGGAEPRAHGAVPTTRRPSRRDHGGSAQARRAAPAQRGREDLPPILPTPHRQEATRILAPFKGGRPL